MKTLIAIGALAVCAYALAAPAAHAQAALGGNLLPALSTWEFKHSGATTGLVSSIKDGVSIDVRGADGLRNARLQEAHLNLAQGHAYHFHCVVSSYTSAQFEVGLIPSSGMNGASVQAVPVSPSWTSVDIDFSAEGIGMNDATLVIYLGGASTIYRLASASLIDANAAPVYVANTPAPPTPTNTPAGAHQGWGLELNGKAEAGTIDSVDGPIIDVDHTDDVPADVEYADEGVSVTNGASYVLHFRARAAASRQVHIEAQDTSPSHHPIGLSSDIKVTPAWQDFNLTFTASNSPDGKARITLMLGGQAGPIQLAELQFASPSSAPQPATQAATPPQNHVLVPIATWDLSTLGSTEAMVSPSTNGATVEIDRADGSPDHVTLKQDGVALDDGKIYELQFKAKASVSRQIPVVAQVDTGATHFVGLNGSIHVTPEWQDYDLKFTAMRPLPAHSRIAFLLGGASGTVDLSDVALQPYGDPVTKVSSSLQGP